MSRYVLNKTEYVVPQNTMHDIASQRINRASGIVVFVQPAVLIHINNNKVFDSTVQQL